MLQGQTWKFIGIENYKKMLTDPDLRIAIFNSLKMMALTVIFQVGIAFVLAVMVSQTKRMQQFFRTVYFFPVVISATAIGLIFKLFYNYNGGMLNQLLDDLMKNGDFSIFQNPSYQKRFKELLGHEPLETFAGTLFGIFIAFVYAMMIGII